MTHTLLLLLPCLAMTCLLAACGGARTVAAPVVPTVESLEQAVVDYYHGHDRRLYGRVTTHLGATTLVQDFSAVLSPSRLDLQWVRTGFTPDEDQSGHLIIDHGHASMTQNVGAMVIGKASQDLSPQFAVAMATGVSFGAAQLVNILWTGDGPGWFPPHASLSTQDGFWTVSGIQATGQAVATTMTLAGQVTQVHQESSLAGAKTAQAAMQKLDDATIRKALSDSGLPATDQDVRTFRSGMETAKKSIATMSGSMITDMVVSDQPLPPLPRPVLPSQPMETNGVE
jgi:hypothetical protein